MTRILSECNLVAVLHEFETKHDVVFKDVETGIQRVTKATAWTLHPRLAEFGIDPTLRREWSRRRLYSKVRTLQNTTKDVVAAPTLSFLDHRPSG